MTTMISYTVLYGFGGILAFAAAFFVLMVGISVYTAFRLPRLAGTRGGLAPPRLQERLEAAKTVLRAKRASEYA